MLNSVAEVLRAWEYNAVRQTSPCSQGLYTEEGETVKSEMTDCDEHP